MRETEKNERKKRDRERRTVRELRQKIKKSLAEEKQTVQGQFERRERVIIKHVGIP